MQSHSSLFIQRLSVDYSDRLEITVEECYAALSELQRNALEKLKQREHFKESGLATIKLKVLNGLNSKLLTKEVSLGLPASRLKETIAKDVHISIEKLVAILYNALHKLVLHYTFSD